MSTSADSPRAQRPPRAAVLLLLAVTFAPAQGATRTFYNVLLPDGADPWVYKHTDGMYYMTEIGRAHV